MKNIKYILGLCLTLVFVFPLNVLADPYAMIPTTLINVFSPDDTPEGVLMVINTQSEVVKPIHVQAQINGSIESLILNYLNFNSDGSQVYVTGSDINLENSYIATIKTEDLLKEANPVFTIISAISDGPIALNNPIYSNIVISSDDETIYVAKKSSDLGTVLEVIKINDMGNTHDILLPNGSLVSQIAITSNDSQVLAADHLAGLVHVIDLNNETVDVIEGLTEAADIVISPNDDLAYVTGLDNTQGSGALYLISLADNTLFNAFQLGEDSFPAGQVLDASGKNLYFATPGTDSVSALDTDDLSIKILAGGVGTPFGVALTPDGTQLYASKAFNITEEQGVSVVDIESGVVHLIEFPKVDNKQYLTTIFGQFISPDIE